MVCDERCDVSREMEVRSSESREITGIALVLRLAAVQVPFHDMQVENILPLRVSLRGCLAKEQTHAGHPKSSRLPPHASPPPPPLLQRQ